MQPNYPQNVQYPPYPPSYPPQPSQPAQQQYAPQPAQPTADPFNDPTGGGGNAPHVRNLDGRTIIIRPIRVDESARFKDASRPTAYFDLVVVDGGPGTFGENLDAGTPATMGFTAPAYFRNAISGNSGIVDLCRNNMGQLVVGVVQRGQKGNRPWLVTKTAVDLDGNDRPDGEARRAAARDLWFKIQSNEFPPTVPTPLAFQQSPSGPPPGSVNYVQPAQPQNAYGHQPPAQPQQQYQPAQMAPSMAQYANAPGSLPAPQGWDPQAWANFPPEAQAKIWQQINAQNAQQSAPAAGAHPGW